MAEGKQKRLNQDLIKGFWKDRSAKEKYIWRDLTWHNLDLAVEFTQWGDTVLSVGCGPLRMEQVLGKMGRSIIGIDPYYYGKLNDPSWIVSAPLFFRRTVEEFYRTWRERPLPQLFDTVLVFGVTHYWEDLEYVENMALIKKMLSVEGCCLVKHQSTTNRDPKYVTTNIDGGTYHAKYRSIHNDMALLGAVFGPAHVRNRKAYKDPDVVEQPDSSFQLYVCQNNLF